MVLIIQGGFNYTVHDDTGNRLIDADYFMKINKFVIAVHCSPIKIMTSKSHLIFRKE
jgi:hypothetical protein